MLKTINGYESKERAQTDRKKSVGDQYAEHHKLDWSKCDGKKPHEVKSKVIVIAGKNDGMY